MVARASVSFNIVKVAFAALNATIFAVYVPPWVTPFLSKDIALMTSARPPNAATG